MSALGFSSCQSVHMSGVWIHTAATNTITLHLALDPEIKPLTFLCFSISAPPTYLAPTVSCEQNTLTRHLFSCLRALVTICHTTLAQVFVRVIPSMCHAPVWV